MHMMITYLSKMPPNGLVKHDNDDNSFPWCMWLGAHCMTKINHSLFSSNQGMDQGGSRVAQER